MGATLLRSIRVYAWTIVIAFGRIISLLPAVISRNQVLPRSRTTQESL